MQVRGVGSTQRISKKKFYRQCELGVGPNTEKLDFNFTDNASWGVGPNKENF